MNDATEPSAPTQLLARRRLIAWMACLPAALQTAAASDDMVLRVGVVPQFDSRTTYDIWAPILASLEALTGLKFQLAGSPNIPEFEKRVGQEEFDLAYLNPYQGLVAADNYLPLVRDIATPLEGIAVVHKDSTIQGLADLQGKTMDFPAPNALAASLMMRSQLDHAGIKVRVRYVKTHTSVYLNVALGQADAGGGVLQTLEDQPDAVRKQLRIIFRTVGVASHPVIAHKRLSRAVREQVRAAFIAMGETSAGRALLLRVPFDRVGQATAEDYLSLKRMGLEKFYVPN